jgi:glycosyltransferase involved in cell wall biosynthesis
VKKINLEFAVVNSVESRYVLPALSYYKVPTVSLVHEFASNTLPVDAFSDVVNYSGEVLFSTQITIDNMVSILPSLGYRSYKVMHQGRCHLPSEDLDDERAGCQINSINELLRPAALPKNALLIVGAGYVQYRKGVDLFLDCANKVLKLAPEIPFHFVWVGSGYDPKNDSSYSVYLADQIRRLGLEDQVHFIGELPLLDDVFESADLFILSSRLDPLPNVAIDALYNGVPVICFDNATGMAQILNDAGIGDLCVANYIDINDMANKVVHLSKSRSRRIEIGSLSKKLAGSKFRMTDYIEKIESLAMAQSHYVNESTKDAKIIFESNLINWNYYNSPFGSFDGQSIESVSAYINAWKKKVGRKPFPGFHPGVYKEQLANNSFRGDPFSDYCKSGQPKGDWINEVIYPQKNDLSMEDIVRVGLHLHVYYIDQLREMIERLSFNSIKPDLLISVSNESDRLFVVNYLSGYPTSKLHIRIVPNIGRDIGPFLTAFREVIQSNYDFIGHVHTKKSVGVVDSSVAQIWSKFLFENLLGSKKINMADLILSRMIEDESIGIVFPDDPNTIGWTQNKAIAEEIANKLGISELPDNFIFPVGSMFWARVSAIKPLFDLKLDWMDYPSEPLPYDGTLLHAIERIFPFVIKSSGYRVVTTYVSDITR